MRWGRPGPSAWSPIAAGALSAWGFGPPGDLLAEGLRRLGDHDAVAALYPVCRESLALGVLGGGSITEKVAGVTAAAAGDFEAAEGHFTAALRLANEREHVAGQAGVRLGHARMLIERNADGDAGRARAMLQEAVPMFEAAGRLRWVRECRELLGARPSSMQWLIAPSRGLNPASPVLPAAVIRPASLRRPGWCQLEFRPW